MNDKNEQALTALAREPGNKTCFSCVGPGSLVRPSSCFDEIIDETFASFARSNGARRPARARRRRRYFCARYTARAGAKPKERAWMLVNVEMSSAND